MLPRPPSCSNLSRPDLHSVYPLSFFPNLILRSSPSPLPQIFLCIPPSLSLSLSLSSFQFSLFGFCAEIINQENPFKCTAHRTHTFARTQSRAVTTTNKREWLSTCNDNRPLVLCGLLCVVANHLPGKFVKVHVWGVHVAYQGCEISFQTKTSESLTKPE